MSTKRIKIIASIILIIFGLMVGMPNRGTIIEMFGFWLIYAGAAVLYVVPSSGKPKLSRIITCIIATIWFVIGFAVANSNETNETSAYFILYTAFALFLYFMIRAAVRQVKVDNAKRRMRWRRENAIMAKDRELRKQGK